MPAFSILDLSPIPEGHTAADALANSVALAQAGETAGYTRYWLAEHHNMPGIASAATSLVIAHIAAATKSIRVGAGGIMLPNHAPLVIAEQFGTLATLYPDRIDLGLGRAPGTDMATARALRRHMAEEDSFPADVQELIGYLGDAPTALLCARYLAPAPMFRSGFWGPAFMVRNSRPISACLMPLHRILHRQAWAMRWPPTAPPYAPRCIWENLR